MTEMVVANKTLYFNADRTKLVEEGDEDAAFLFAREGTLVDKEEAKKYGAKLRGETVEMEPVPGSAMRETEWVVVKEPHQAPGSPAVEGAGKSTKPVTPADKVGAARSDALRMTEAPEEPGDPQATPDEAEREAGVQPDQQEEGSEEQSGDGSEESEQQ